MPRREWQQLLQQKDEADDVYKQRLSCVFDFVNGAPPPKPTNMVIRDNAAPVQGPPTASKRRDRRPSLPNQAAAAQGPTDADLSSHPQRLEASAAQESGDAHPDPSRGHGSQATAPQPLIEGAEPSAAQLAVAETNTKKRGAAKRVAEGPATAPDAEQPASEESMQSDADAQADQRNGAGNPVEPMEDANTPSDGEPWPTCVQASLCSRMHS